MSAHLTTGEATPARAGVLLSCQSDWVTGQVFTVDGGRPTVRVKG